MTEQEPERFDAIIRYDTRSTYKLSDKDMKAKANKTDDWIQASHKELLTKLPRVLCPDHQTTASDCGMHDGEYRTFFDYYVSACCCDKLIAEMTKDSFRKLSLKEKVSQETQKPV